MNIIVRSTLCARHPDTAVDAAELVRDAIRDGTLGRLIFTNETDQTPVPAGQKTLGAELREGRGRVLIVDCACRIEPGLLRALANVEGTTVVVAEAGADPRAATVTLPDGEGGPRTVAYLGSLLICPAERADLAAILAAGGGRLSWPDAVSRLAERSPVRTVMLTEDVHRSEILVERKLAGGSYARTYVRLQSAFSGRTVRKEAQGAGLSKLTDEITWLGGLEQAAKMHFPRLQEYRIEPYGASMDLAYHHLPTLRRLIFAGEIDEEETAAWMRRILFVLDTELYPAGDRPAPADYVRHTHLDRIRERIDTCAVALPDRRELWTAEKVRVNGTWLWNAHILIDAIGQDERMLRLLTPDRLVRTHGDLHFDNILIDRDNRRFLLIDPRGNPGYDVAYDLGKVWHSLNSMYDLIHEGHVRVDSSGDRIDYEFTSPELVGFYTRVRRSLQSWLETIDVYRPDPYWMLKLRLAEASHMCSVMPFHIAQDRRESVVLSCYGRGLELINQLYADLSAETGSYGLLHN